MRKTLHHNLLKSTVIYFLFQVIQVQNQLINHQLCDKLK